MIGHPDEAAREANKGLGLKFRAMLDQEMFTTSRTLWGVSHREGALPPDDSALVYNGLGARLVESKYSECATRA